MSLPEIRIAPLVPGDLVGIAAPASPALPEQLAAARGVLEGFGFRVRVAPGVTDRRGYLAGEDGSRAEGFNALVADPAVRAILFGRGGYGTGRILDRLDLEGLLRRPRLLVGFSDLTALFLALQARAGYPVGYGPNVADLARPARYQAASFRRFLCAGPGGQRLDLRGCRTLVPGRARGRLVGGCLTLIQSLLGTPWMPDLEGAILFWEDWQEEPYRIDRMLNHLRCAGVLRGIRAMVVGRPVRILPRRGRPSLDLDEILLDHVGPLGVPLVVGLPAGHCARKITLTLGLPALLDTVGAVLEIGSD